MSYLGTLKAFCEELAQTFPELATPIARAATIPAAQFWSSWQGSLQILLDTSAPALFAEKRGFLIGAVRLTEGLWCELSPATQGAIWKYLRTLVLEAVMEIPHDGIPTEVLQQVHDILTVLRLESGGQDASAAVAEMMEESLGHLAPLMERLKGILGGFDLGLDLSGLADIPMPEIPERLKKGHIARLAEEMAKQFNPADFGIDPAVLEGDNMEDVLRRLAELYQRDPSLLLGGAKRVADKIKTRILGGSLNREELVAEAQEFIALFKEHPLFKEAIDKFQGLVGEGGLAEMFGGGNTGAPSERRRAVQERLRKKLAARSRK
jgi:hypothetical protein